MPAVIIPEFSNLSAHVLVVFPTVWDVRQLEACRSAWSRDYTVEFTAPSDADCDADFDVMEFIGNFAARSDFDAVCSSSDYPGAAVAAAIAAQRSLPGALPAAVLRCAHKYYARVAQRLAVPESVPDFALLDPAKPAASTRTLAYPCFVKPVKGAFSVLARQVASPSELDALLGSECVRDYLDSYLRIFDRLLRAYTDCALDSRYFLAEQLLSGVQVTVEGFVQHGEVQILGVVDSVMHPGTRSFARFEYPSALNARVQARLGDVARRIVRAHGLDHTLFNVELLYDPATERIGVVEINPRLCGQFADLYQKVDGTNTYEVALALAAGRRPVVRHRDGASRVAASLPLRVFSPSRVLRAPGAADIRAAEALFPGTLIWVECEAGQDLCDFDRNEDGCSARYAVVNVGAADRERLAEHFEVIQSRLGFDFEPSLAPTPV